MNGIFSQKVSLYHVLDQTLIILQEVEKQLEMAKKGISIHRASIAEKKTKMREELEKYKSVGVKKLKPFIIQEEKKEAAEK